MSNVITENKEKQCHESYNTKIFFGEKLPLILILLMKNGI